MSSLLTVAAMIYALSGISYFAWLALQRDLALKIAGRLLVLAVVVHLAGIGQLCLRGFHPLLDTSGMLNLISWTISLGYLLTTLKWKRLGMLGAMVTPVVLVLLISARVTPRAIQTAASHGSLWGKIHLTLIALGMTAFALSAALSLVYLLQESALRRNRLTSVFRRTPALNTLDRLSCRLAQLGFPIFTLAIGAGVIWFLRGSGVGGFRLEYVIAAATWLIFAALILARRTVGISGRNAAWVTIAGFAAMVAVLLLYAGRRIF